MGWLFRFLFKYPAFLFEQGEFRFSTSLPVAIGLIVTAAFALASLVTYRTMVREQGARDRVVLVALRVATVLLLLFCLFRPLLVLKAAVPQQNFLGILLDDSRSMTIADRGGQPRTQFVQQ